MNWPTIRRYRFSDIVTAICLPIVIILIFQASFLSKNLQALSNTSAAGLETSGDPFEAGEISEDIRKSAEFNTVNVVHEVNIQLPVINETSVGRVGFPLNNTIRAKQDLLIFTPIRRSGSSSVRNLLKNLKIENGFIMVSSPPKLQEVVHLPDKANQASNAHKISGLNETAAVIANFPFINFTEFGHQQPIQVSVVRDPLERAISEYYFVRAPYRLVENVIKFPEAKLPPRMFLKKPIESCLGSKNDEECLYEKNKLLYGHTIEYFCGHEPFCPLFGNVESLQRAKNVVENNFAVVGIIEEWEKTVLVLEHFVPKFFKGSSRVFQENVKNGTLLLNRNIYKPKVDDWARKLLKERLSIEYEFYEFLRQRLNKQYEALLKNRHAEEVSV